ncbi:hypothetical protein Tco_1122111 [Tanacetum coccineum]|uniref:Uncharacterized protein n=1 Tax=Tanacetum coccineum TaxID=301880 RepID=A0ABQ5IZM4_9ASTR
MEKMRYGRIIVVSSRISLPVSHEDIIIKVTPINQSYIPVSSISKKSGLLDEVFTTCVIKRYCRDQWDDSSVAVVAAFDGVQGTSVLVGNSLVPSCYAIFDLEPLSLYFDFIFTSEISKSLSISLDHLCHLAILCLDQHAHTLHHLENTQQDLCNRLDWLIWRTDLIS